MNHIIFEYSNLKIDNNKFTAENDMLFIWCGCQLLFYYQRQYIVQL